ncbi:tRNA pseudouridine55 synthase [Clostridium sp. USBA 49]|jgi:tRNA pseudouridine55 synthase|uniref:tRNA pseudouridine(55) synthase TruB n=1 Tax=Clostridium TaxID=1485 RepID=UPI00099925EA|nr:MULTISPECIES: tRNA pseudouridine(55) synthase TruB [Clostridium]SKA76507.1 tRNA pseudouridine55 synthase [Clostridium sp. USBA 49]
MNGVINIYKPSGITSFQAVKKIMNVCNTKKVGHTGTLDPLASGVLPICIGKATKIVDFIMSDTKVYNAELILGIETDTYDKEGKIISQKNVNIDKKHVESVILSYIGEIMQEPPMYSALKVNGKRLYELAREGKIIERNKRKVFIYDIKIREILLPFVKFTVTCSKGTYIRSLCNDIGKSLNVGATLWNLERIKTGSFNLEDSVHLDIINNTNIVNYIIPIDKVLNNYEKLSFNSKYEKLLINGVKINNKYILGNIKINKLYRVYIDNDKFIGLGIKDDEGFKITKLLI